MSFAKRGAEIFRDYVTVGVPGSGAHEPIKSDIRSWMLAVESAAGNFSLRWTWDTGTTDADPGAGQIRANNATLSSATQLYINEDDANAIARDNLLAIWDDSTNTVRGTFTITDMADLTNYAIFNLTGAITDAGDYRKLPVTYVAAGGSFAADADLGIMFTRSGDAATVGGSLGATDNQLVRTDGTGGATAQGSAVSLDDSGNLTGIVGLTATGTVEGGTVTQGGVAVWRTVMKTADETIQSDTTLGVDATLKVTMLANTKYAIRAKIFFDSGATGDFKWRHSGPASPTLVRLVRVHVVPGGAAYAGVAVDTAYSSADITLNGSASAGWVEFDAIIHNGANAGDFEFQWAQNASEAVNTTVRAGSYLDYRSL